MKLLPVVAVWLAALVAASAQSGGAASATPTPPAAPRAAGVAVPRPSAPVQTPARAVTTPQPSADAGLLKQYCATCHNERTKVAGLVLDPAGLEHVGTEPEVWEKVVRKIKTGMMPPSGMPRPERTVLDGFASGLEARLDRANPPGAHPDAPALHRLNRTEYANAIRDLLAIEVDVKALLPSDDSNEGFDNLAEALTVSPSLVQGYVAAAMKISRQAVGDRSVAPSQVTYSAPGRQTNTFFWLGVDPVPEALKGPVMVTV